jgi:hypothetical protein
MKENHVYLEGIGDPKMDKPVDTKMDKNMDVNS